MTDFDYNQEDVDQLNSGGMNTGGGVRLPFTAPNFYFQNGNGDPTTVKRLEKSGQPIPVEFYGGWGVDSEAFEEAVENYGDLAGVQLDMIEQVNRENKEYAIYFTRHMVLAPIAYRDSWVTDNNGATVRRSKYFEGARHHVQLLALIAKRNGDKYEAWGPAVLTAKGYQAQNLLDAAKTWDATLAKLRKEHAPKIPPWGFWMALGTFAPNIEIEMKGKAGRQSPITPMRLAQFREYDLDLLKRLFVGKEGLSKMADYLRQADEWLKAWRQEQPNDNGGNGGEPEFDNDHVPEHIPF